MINRKRKQKTKGREKIFKRKLKGRKKAEKKIRVPQVLEIVLVFNF